MPLQWRECVIICIRKYLAHKLFPFHDSHKHTENTESGCIPCTGNMPENPYKRKNTIWNLKMQFNISRHSSQPWLRRMLRLYLPPVFVPGAGFGEGCMGVGGEDGG